MCEYQWVCGCAGTLESVEHINGNQCGNFVFWLEMRNRLFSHNICVSAIFDGIFFVSIQLRKSNKRNRKANEKTRACEGVWLKSFLNIII